MRPERLFLQDIVDAADAVARFIDGFDKGPSSPTTQQLLDLDHEQLPVRHSSSSFVPEQFSARRTSRQRWSLDRGADLVPRSWRDASQGGA